MPILQTGHLHTEPDGQMTVFDFEGIQGIVERLEYMGVVVGRHINGITVKPLEYLLDDMGEMIVFRSEDRARKYFKGQGWTEEQIYRLVFEGTESEYNLG